MPKRGGEVRLWILFVILGLHFSAAASVPRQIQVGCSILDVNGKLLRSFSGEFCRYFPDGKVLLSHGTTGLALYDSEMKLLWERKMHVHHMLRETNDHKLLVLSSSVHLFRNVMTRFDKIYKFDMNGNVEGSFDFFANVHDLENANPLLLARGLGPYEWDHVALPEVHWEYSHANSVFEIPLSPAAKSIPAFQAGNIIVNVSSANYILILDKDLKKILYSFTYLPNFDGDLVTHDVQVLKNGHLLVYVNNRQIGNNYVSTLEEFDQVEKKLVWQFHPKRSAVFNSKFSGGVQILDDGNILYSDTTRGGEVVEINRQGQELMRWSVPWVDPKTSKPLGLQEAKQLDLSQFLQHNRGI